MSVLNDILLNTNCGKRNTMATKIPYCCLGFAFGHVAVATGNEIGAAIHNLSWLNDTG